MGKKALTKEQVNKITSLRQKGYSLPELKKKLPFGYGTIFKYIKGVEILPEFREYWLDKKRASVYRKKQTQEKARQEAEKIIRALSYKEKVIIAACLYWAEGSKRDFCLSNTDPVLIKAFIDCLQSIGVGKDKISINIRIYEDIDKRVACKFWANVVGISIENISYVVVLKGKKKGKLKYGMCRIRILKGAYHLKLINSLKDIISEKI